MLNRREVLKAGSLTLMQSTPVFSQPKNLEIERKNFILNLPVLGNQKVYIGYGFDSDQIGRFVAMFPEGFPPAPIYNAIIAHCRKPENLLQLGLTPVQFEQLVFIENYTRRRIPMLCMRKDFLGKVLAHPEIFRGTPIDVYNTTTWQDIEGFVRELVRKL